VQQLGPLAQAIDAGLLVIDGGAVDACLGTVETLATSCTIIDTTTLPSVCAALFVATVAIGGTCGGGGVRCADGVGICIPGDGGVTCTVLPGSGADCTQGQCAAGLTCSPDNRCRDPLLLGDACGDGGGCPTGAACLQGECRTRLTAGQPGCARTTDCLDGLVCSDDGVCAVGPARGDACGGAVCGSGDACVRSYAERRCGARVPDGAPCTFDADCENGFCAASTALCAALPDDGDLCPDTRCTAGFACDVDNGGVCVPAPAAGEACLTGPAACAPGLGCNVDNVCAPGPGVGGACLIPNNLCADGLACDFTPDGSICAVRRGVGAPCQNDVCKAGLFCSFADGTCQPVRAVGDACRDGGGCADGDECGDLLGGFRCHPIPDAADAPCFTACGNDLACFGDGGVCAPALCASF
jgi:hypothetical protein